MLDVSVVPLATRRYAPSMRTSWVLFAAVSLGCSGSSEDAASQVTEDAAAEETLAADTGTTVDTGSAPDVAVAEAAGDAVAETAAPSDAGADTAKPPINVDPTNPKRYDFTFKANEADAAAKESLGTQGGYVDTRVKAKGKLVVFLHGAGDQAPTSCTSGELANVVTAMGFHLFTPCYNSYYGVGACGNDIGGCRLEAFEGIDHTNAIDIKPADAIEPRVVAGLKLLAKRHPGGDWTWFLDGDKPRWSDIVIAGISHGASTSGVVGMVRRVDRAVMLSGPLDTNQAWLKQTPLTALDRFYGFTHTADSQHSGHLGAFEAMKLPGAVTSVDGATPPFGSSHRLKTSAATSNGHGSTMPGGASPKTGSGAYVFLPVWKYLFGG